MGDRESLAVWVQPVIQRCEVDYCTCKERSRLATSWLVNNRLRMEEQLQKGVVFRPCGMKHPVMLVPYPHEFMFVRHRNVFVSDFELSDSFLNHPEGDGPINKPKALERDP